MVQVKELRAPARAGRDANGRKSELAVHLERELGHLSDELTVRIPGELGRPSSDMEYRTTVERQKSVQRRIRLLRQLIAGLPLVEPDALQDDRAGYGSVVLLRNLDTGDEVEYTLMAGEHIDIDENQVSLASPVGYALVGRRAGEEAVVVAPQGRRRFRVVTVETLPQRLGLVEPPPPSAA